MVLSLSAQYGSAHHRPSYLCCTDRADRAAISGWKIVTRRALAVIVDVERHIDEDFSSVATCMRLDRRSRGGSRTVKIEGERKHMEASVRSNS
jgi:hypothetical protein